MPAKKQSSLFGKIMGLARSVHSIAPFYDPRYPRVLKRAVELRLRHGFSPDEALALGLLRPDFPDDTLRNYVSKREMSRIQKTLNPAAWSALTQNKGIFYKYCTALGIPVPRLYAIFFRDTAGYAANGTLLTSPEQWRTFIEEQLPREFVVKPTSGVYGSGFRCFTRSPDGAFVDQASGNSCDAGGIWGILRAAGDDFVLQERLRNDPALIELSQTESLQTVRVWTGVDRYGESHILQAFLKIIVGKNLTDNLDSGKSGNLCASVDIANGTLQPAVQYNLDGSGLSPVTHHPRTGMRFQGFLVPWWDAVCDVAREAARKMLPLRVHGWDIAMTPEGPCVVECNIFSDPTNQFGNAVEILGSISRLSG